MTDKDNHDWLLDLALIGEAARRAGDVALGYFRQSPDVWFKNEGRSPVSAADLAANTLLEEMLRPARPTYGWLSEENDDDAARLDCETVFVVDPIDGTRAFIAGEETWCVSVAVVHHGRPVAAALFAPVLNEEFLAAAGLVPTRNGAAIAVSQPQGDAPLRLATPQDLLGSVEPGLRQTLERVPHIPSLAYRLAIVADGRIDATLVKRNSHDWDLAAADLILERAGGLLCGLDGQPLRYNRPDVRHEMLCAAPIGIMPRLLQGLGGRAPG
ncbi:3'(2'),5'-bisphosphate nucleotidase CysQ [Rhizobium halophytocola]|uniref:Myo-inositol-1(Or 4)-monophosphatase n=1 Tax=Rhizobium halophytocola TaxID=735519 RepID=A0ABS4DXL8_9HYPH|nr:3'(2'),5'-bisphosphate nucleotidase CysQ [Rhizobium halophytocola]MBP1850446.1 myo-inositol-1(or 4)-monophosphatase [Rhizobium halophytocola]